MDYERKYKEANDKVAVRFGTNVAKEIFTDLYESEDERIRKKLIIFFQRFPYTNLYDIDLNAKNVLAWLEKQGEKKVSEYDVVKTIKERIIEYFDNHLIIDKCFSIGGLKDDILKIINEAKFEKQGEQKPIDNVEQKFKVGDWIVNNVSKDIFLIRSVNSGYCSLEDTKGNIYFPCLPFESDFHLWTIQDAKDGDILVYNNSIFIFNEIYKNWLIYYGIYENDKFHNDKCYSFLDLDTIDINNIHPATKEQRDILFQKMKEAEYEWDAEKKELSKRVIDEGKSEMDYCFTKMMNGEKVSPIWSEEDETGWTNKNFCDYG